MFCSKKIILMNFIVLFSFLLITEYLPKSNANRIVPGYSNGRYEMLPGPSKRMSGMRFEELLRLQKLKDSAKWLEELGKRAYTNGVNSWADEEYH
ncbi:unnamed protein product [Trichobilharzia szidati]|nr:unnamed protein product [Trichobilharzia szidati]CAH8853439.1 unnamed protein product [Trichobilharzia szidati]